MGKLHKAVVQIKVGWFYRHSVVFFKRCAVPSKGIRRTDHHECPWTATTDSPQTLPIGFACGWNSYIEPNPEMR